MARIAVAATAPFGADVLERLAERHEVASLLTRRDAPAGSPNRGGFATADSPSCTTTCRDRSRRSRSSCAPAPASTARIPESPT